MTRPAPPPRRRFFFTANFFEMYYDLNRMTAAFDRLSRHDSPWTTFHSILDFFLLPHRYYPTGEELAAAHQQLLAWPDKEIIVEFLTAMTDLQPPKGDFRWTR